MTITNEQYLNPIDLCFPVNHQCVEDWDDYPEPVQEFGDIMAAQTLRMLTAYQVGGCPVIVRPCRKGCSWTSYLIAPVEWTGYNSSSPFMPHINPLGYWVNGCGCGADGCSCKRLCKVLLPPPVGLVNRVEVDGAVLDASQYRVDNGRELIRTDGECWPVCQDMEKPLGEVGTFGVEYLNAYPVDQMGAIAAGYLAAEFAKACTNRACLLPRGVTQIARQGVTFTVATGAFPGGLTGIMPVDAYINRWNPNHLKMPVGVYSPDIPQTRHTTWSG